MIRVYFAIMVGMNRCLPLLILITLLICPLTLNAGEYFFLNQEPLVRIGLTTNASSVSITTSDTQLVAYSPDEASRFLATNKVAVSARAYRPPEVEDYRFEIQNLPTAAEADDVAKEVREQTGQSAIVSIDVATNTWKVWIGPVQDTTEEADAFKAMLAEKGFEDVTMVTEKKVVHSEDAVALSRQLTTAGKSEVRSLIKTTGTTSVAMGPDLVNPNLREVIVNGGSEPSKYASLKSVSFGSFNERAVPVRLNGKAYRGKLEVFVNSRGALTVVNVVPLEDYLLGVVPAELSLPHLEAQKAQAIAARTYAVANVNTYGTKGFDMVPTVWSQVYKGVAIETKMGTEAVRQTRGMVATYQGKPIMAYFTSTCGGRTENVENVFDTNEPYLRGVECSLEGKRHFDPFLIRTIRQPARVRNEEYVELVRLMSLLAVNGFSLTTNQFTDDWFDEEPSVGEISNWLNQLATRFGKTFPNVTKETAKPLELARVLASLAYAAGAADTLLSDSDVNYHLSFDDSAEVPKERRAELAMLMRDELFILHSDLTLKPQKPFRRADFLRLIRQVYEKKKWMPVLQTGTTKASVDGKLVLRSGRTERQLTIRPDVFLFRKFGAGRYPIKEAALVGGETVNYQTDASGAVMFLEIEPTDMPTVAENMSPFTNWTTSLSASAVQSRLSRYVRGIGTLYDVNIRRQGYSRRAAEIEIIGSNGVKTLKGGKIRSALRLREQLFVMNKRYTGNQVAAYTFTGRGWGHGVGMCQYGAYGLAKMGVKYDEIVKHYYTGVDVTKAY
ncbi:MAG TPA: SpoIID/LytB domain-containing protein [Pyrinomonadaceae bacterium]|nr:SpoIID/LytB domain-containing protein [Pyrinomonadaceae bacterium]